MIKLNSYDVLIIGHPCKDVNVEHTGETQFSVGGAVIYSVHSAVACGARVGAVMKYAPEDKGTVDNIPLSPADVYFRPAERTTSIRNEYLSADRERRRCRAVAPTETIYIEDIPPVSVGAYQLAGLMRGDYDPGMIVDLSKQGPVGADAQGWLRYIEDNGDMITRDWPEIKEYLPYITWFKTDAAEAEILTGLTETRKAAECIRGWGAKEVMVSHNTEMVVCTSDGISSWPVVSRKIAGRTGRGDTIFAAYIAERRHSGPDDALRFATAAVSLKMEMPTPLIATRAEIQSYMDMLLPKP